MDHRPYPISLLVQSSIPNIQNSIYPLALPNVACREPTTPSNSIFLTKNVMEQNLVGFPNSMYIMLNPIHHFLVLVTRAKGVFFVGPFKPTKKRMMLIL